MLMTRILRELLRTLATLTIVINTAWCEDPPPADPAADLYYGANGLYNRKLYPLAADQYANFLKKYPNHEKAANARLGLAMCQFAEGDYQKAEPALRKALSQNGLPQAAQVRLMLAQCLVKLDKLDEAQTAFEQASKTSNSDSLKGKALSGLVEVSYQQKDWDATIQHSDALLKVHANGPLAERARYQGGMARFEQKQFDDAAKHLEPFARQLKDSPFAHYGLFLFAESLRAKEDYKKAAEAYDEVADGVEGPYRADARFFQGFCAFETGDYRDAARTLDRFLDDHPDHASRAQRQGSVRLVGGRGGGYAQRVRALVQEPGGADPGALRAVQRGGDVHRGRRRDVAGAAGAAGPGREAASGRLEKMKRSFRLRVLLGGVLAMAADDADDCRWL